MSKENKILIVDTYVAMNRDDIEEHLNDREKSQLQNIAKKINRGRERSNKEQLKVLVVDSKWPIYKDVEALIKAMVAGMLN